MALQLDTRDSLLGRILFAALIGILPIQCIESAASSRLRNSRPFAWFVAWTVILAEAALGSQLLISGREVAGATYVLSLFAVGAVSACGLRVPLNPSIDWDLVTAQQIFFVHTSTGGRTYDTLITGWKKAEEVAAAWLRRLGYPDAHVTPPGPDNGIDVESRRAIAQVKWTSKRVGVKDVQRVPGAAVLGQAHFFFSARGYTRPVLRWAENPDHRVALFRMQPSGHLVACNYHARRALFLARPYIVPDEIASPRPEEVVSRRRRYAAFEIVFSLIFALSMGFFIWIAVWALTANAGRVAVLSMVGFAVCMALALLSAIRRPLSRLFNDLKSGRHPSIMETFSPLPPENKREENLPSDGFIGYARDPILRALIAIEDFGIHSRALRRRFSRNGK